MWDWRGFSSRVVGSLRLVSGAVLQERSSDASRMSSMDCYNLYRLSCVQNATILRNFHLL